MIAKPLPGCFRVGVANNPKMGLILADLERLVLLRVVLLAAVESATADHEFMYEAEAAKMCVLRQAISDVGNRLANVQKVP